MLRRAVPGTDLELSVIGFGCWAIGGRWWGDDVRDEVSVRAIHEALDCGINWFDTAPLYGHGHADEVLVRALGPRLREVVVATKVGVRWGGEGEHARSDLSPEHVREDTEQSLRRLGVERIDLLQVHWPCEAGTPLEDTLDALESLRRAGKVRHYGLCNYDAAAVRRAVDHGGVVTLQTPYSLLRRELESGLLDACRRPGEPERSLGVLAYEPLARGLLTGKFQREPSFPASDLRSRDERFRGTRFGRANAFAQVLGQVAAKVGVPPAALALGWVCARPGITAAIAGAKTPEQVRENARGAELVGRARLWESLQPLVDRYRG